MPDDRPRPAAGDRPEPRRGGAHRRPSARGRRRRAPEPAVPPAAAEEAQAGVDARAGWLTSPPLRGEPWAGLPEERGDEDGRAAADRGEDGPTAPAARRRVTWRGGRLVLIALAVAAVLVLGALNVVTRLYPGPPGNPYTSTSTKAAVAAATAAAVPILSYDYRTIGQQENKVKPLVTASCASEYAKLLTTTVAPLAVQNKATQKATVLSAGVSSAATDAVTVLAFVQLTSSNSVKSGQAINEAQLSLSMVRQQGRWLLTGTSAGGSPDVGPPSCGGVGATGK